MTNTDLPTDVIMARYRDLWTVEHSFRITKSDLKARPVFHRSDQSIIAHLTIVFAALAISKYIEIKSGLSIRKALKILNNIRSHKVFNISTGESSIIQSSIENPNIQAQINTLNSLGH